MNEIAPPTTSPEDQINSTQGYAGLLAVGSTATLELDKPPYALSREEKLRLLLPYDYEYAVESGLIDIFYYDEQSGSDGLLHTLVGERRSGPLGIMGQGFHHEESGAQLSPRTIMGSGEVTASTRVDESHLEGANAKRRKQFAQYPGDYYSARVSIHNLPKENLVEDPDTGKIVAKPINNGMYPKEYDAMAVLQTIRIAYESRDTSQDVLKSSAQLGNVLVNQADVVLLDGKSTITIRLVMDAESKKIQTAIPIVNGPVMKLTREALMDSIVHEWKH